MFTHRVIPAASIIFASAGLGLLLVFAADPWGPPSIENVVTLGASRIDLPPISAFDTQQHTFEIRNISGDVLDFRLLADCNCLHFEPAMGQIAVDKVQVVQATYRPIGFSPDQGWRGVDHKQIMVDVRTPHFEGSLELLLEATVIKPFVFDSSRLNVRCQALATAEFRLDLSLLSGVERIEIVSAPEFLRDLELSERHPVFDAISITGQIAPQLQSVSRSQSQPLVVRAYFVPQPATEQAQAEQHIGSFDITLPISLIIDPPFTADYDRIEARPGQERSLTLTASSHLESLEILTAACDDPAWTIEVVDGNQIQLSLAPASDSLRGIDNEHSSECYLKLVVACKASGLPAEKFEWFASLGKKGVEL